MKEEYDTLEEYLLDLLKEGHWDGQLYIKEEKEGGE